MKHTLVLPKPLKMSLGDIYLQEDEVDVFFSTPLAKYNKNPGWPTKREKIFANPISDKGPESREYKITLITQQLREK